MKRSRLELLLAWSIASLAFATSAGATELVLQNGWTSLLLSPNRTEAFADDGIVYFKGALSSGTSDVLFTLPPALRPASRVYVAIDLCDAKPGRLIIQPSGVVSVQSAASFADAQCLTSLDGAKFAPSGAGFTSLTLTNGWTGAPFSTSAPTAALIDGIVHLKGAVAGGSSNVVTTLPVEFRPATDVYVPINLCTGTKGRLRIQSSGIVSVDPFGADAQCFTGLDGASFAPSASGFTPLALENGWSGAPFSTSPAEASSVDGIVRFKGAIANGSNAILFTLPEAMRPADFVFVAIDLCLSAPGRLIIEPSGVVSVDAAAANFPGAQCFTSLDGASFVLPAPTEFTPLSIRNGWGNGFYGTQTTSVALRNGIVHFKGALTNGSSALLFTLPVALRPESDLAVAVDLYLGNVGRLIIQSNGDVFVESTGPFSHAGSFTSLEGVSFALTSNGFTPITLTNGWLGAPFTTSPPAAARIDGIVHFKGAIASGTDGFAFTLPPALRPESYVYLQIGLCGGAKGRLAIAPSGEVFVVSSTGDFVLAQCVTSLDGAKFAPNEASFADRVLENGWTDTIYSTSHAAAAMVRDVVYLKGAIANGSNASPFTLPPILRPEGFVYVPIDLFGGAKGRLVIHPTGVVSVESLNGFPIAQDFTSLDGVSYAVPEPSTAAALVSGALLLSSLRRSRGRYRHSDPDAGRTRRV